METLKLLCTEINADAGAPEWIQVLPPGPVIKGRDGRRFKASAPEKIVEAFRSGGLKLPVDWEHATELRAPQGLDAPAAGWVTDLELRADGMWAKVEWNATGASAVADKAYKYVSPVLLVERKSGEIKSMTSIGLTNKPNLELLALNRQEEEGKRAMQLEAIAAALGLAEDASQEDIITQVNSLKAGPDLTTYVAREELETALNRAQKAEESLAAVAAEALSKEINATLDEASKAGKITPAQREHYAALCQQDGGLDLFRKIVASAPVIVDDQAQDLSAATNAAATLDEDQKALCRQLGISEEEYLKA